MKADVAQVDNIIAKMIVYSCKGDFMPQHVHAFDHAHLVGHGVIRVIVEGEEDRLYEKGEMIKIVKHKAHKLIAETDDAVSFCIHALKESEIGSDQEFKSVLV